MLEVQDVVTHTLNRLESNGSRDQVIREVKLSMHDCGKACARQRQRFL